jgi:hypothetical protein
VIKIKGDGGIREKSRREVKDELLPSPIFSSSLLSLLLAARRPPTQVSIKENRIKEEQGVVGIR